MMKGSLRELVVTIAELGTIKHYQRPHLCLPIIIANVRLHSLHCGMHDELIEVQPHSSASYVLIVHSSQRLLA